MFWHLLYLCFETFGQIFRLKYQIFTIFNVFSFNLKFSFMKVFITIFNERLFFYCTVLNCFIFFTATSPPTHIGRSLRYFKLSFTYKAISANAHQRNLIKLLEPLLGLRCFLSALQIVNILGSLPHPPIRSITHVRCHQPGPAPPPTSVAIRHRRTAPKTSHPWPSPPVGAHASQLLPIVD